MKANLYKLISLLVLALLVAGCAAAVAKEPTPAATSTPIPEPKESQPTTAPGPDAAETLVALSTEDLQKRLGADAGIAVLEVVPVEFSDASLGVPEPGQTYAQVLTPGFVIRLAVDDQVFEYHAGNGRAILASVVTVNGEVTIESVQVSQDAVLVGGRSTFPNGTPIQTELLAGGQGAIWWPEGAYATVQGGAWQIAVPLNGAALDPAQDYVVYAWAENDESSKVSFPFDLTGPPSDPVPPASGEAEYSRVEIAEPGLSIEVPAGWLRLEPEWVWTPAEGSELYLGVLWADLQPPQEAEATLLPTPSQTLYSEQVPQILQSVRLSDRTQ